MSGKQERATELVRAILRESDGMEPWLTTHFAEQCDTPEEQAEFDRIGEAVASWASKVRALRALSNEVEQPVSTGPNKPGTVEALARAEAERAKAVRVECASYGHDWPIKQPQDMEPGTSQTCARCGVTVTQHLRGRTYRWPNERTRQFMDCRDCATLGYHSNTAGCLMFEQTKEALTDDGISGDYLAQDGTEGQDRESYSDDQDRDSYEVNDEDTRGDR